MFVKVCIGILGVILSMGWGLISWLVMILMESMMCLCYRKRGGMMMCFFICKGKFVWYVVVLVVCVLLGWLLVCVIGVVFYCSFLKFMIREFSFKCDNYKEVIVLFFFLWLCLILVFGFFFGFFIMIFVCI